MTISLNEFRLSMARWGVLLLLGAASVNAYLTRHSLGVVNTTIQKELGINNEQFGYLYGVFSLGYMIFQIPGGWLGQRFGVRYVLPAMACLWSLTTFGTACMTTFIGLLMMRMSYGIAQAGLVPNQAIAVRDWIDPAGRGVASSVMVVAMSAGSVASMLLTPMYLKSFDWRTILIAYSLTGVMWAVLFVLLYRVSPQAARWLHEEPRDIDPPTPLHSTDALPAKVDTSHPPLLPMSTLIVLPTLWGLAIQAVLKAAGYNLAVTFLPALLEYMHGIQPENSGPLVTSSLIAFITGSSFGGLLVDRAFQWTGSKYISRSVVAASMLILAAVFTSLAGFAQTAAQTAIWLSAGSFFSGLASASPWVAVMDVGGKSTAVFMGFMNSFSALGGVLFSPLAGKIIDEIKRSEGDWSLVFLLHGAYYLVAGLAWLAVNPNRTLESEEPHRAD